MKKQLKKTLSLILSLMMIMSMFAGLDILSFAEDDILSYLTYEINDGEVTIIDCDESISGDVTIPDTIEGYPVTVIGGKAFVYCNNLTDIQIPDTVTTIDNGAFSNCKSLKSITIPESVTIIGGNAFRYCNKLNTITIIGNFTSIGEYAFSQTAYYNNEDNWKNDILYIGNHLIEIKNNMSETYEIKQGTKIICASAFSGFNSLASIEIPDSVTLISELTFANCYNLNSITVNENNQYYSNDEQGVLYNKDKTVLIQYPLANSGTEYIIPDGVISIGDYAFSCCDTLGTIKISNSVISIGNSAFAYCDGLTDITIGNSVKTIGDYAFRCCDGFKNIIIPDSVIIIGNGAFYQCGKLENLIIGSSVTTIGDEAFYNCFRLEKITIPGSIKIIGIYALAACYALETVYYGGSQSDWNSIVASGNRLLDVVFHYNYTDFESHYSKEVFAPTCTIDGYTLYTCLCGDSYRDDFVDALSHKFENNYCKVCEEYILACKIEDDKVEITSCDESISGDFVIPYVIEGYPVEAIGAKAFLGCKNLTSITIPDSVTTIGNYALGYYFDDFIWGYALVKDFVIYSAVGSAAEKYANENGITFISVAPEEPPVDEPPVEDPPVDNPPVDNPPVEDPPVDNPPVEEPPVEEPPVEEPPVEEPPVEEPPVDEPPVEEPADNGQLEVKGEGGIVTDFENKISQIGKEVTIETLSSMIENENFAIVDKNGNTIADNAFVGTGSKIQILAEDGSVLNEYTIVVPTDIDGNGKTTAADARLALRSAAKLDTLEGVYFTAADVTGDGKVNASDARKILRISAGLEK